MVDKKTNIKYNIKMKQGITTKIIAGLIALLLAVSGFLGGISYVYTTQTQLGTTIPIVVALFETSLASKITSTATSMTLITGTDKEGNSLSGTYGFVIDEGTASEEFVTASCTATACSSLARGISVVTGNTEITALKKSHRRGASVKISNHPQLAVISRILNGDETIPNIISYASQPTFTGNEEIPTKKYVDDTVSAGAPDASTTTKGLVEIATTAELIAGTASGGTSALLVAPNSFFNDGSSATNLVPVTGTDGKLSQGFLDLTEGYTWTGAHVFNTNDIDINVNVDISGTLAVGSTTTFTGAPSYASDPGSANVLTRKSYVDGLVWSYDSVVEDTNGDTFDLAIPAGTNFAIIQVYDDHSGDATTGKNYLSGQLFVSKAGLTTDARTVIARRGASGGGSVVEYVHLEATWGASLTGRIFTQENTGAETAYTDVSSIKAYFY